MASIVDQHDKFYQEVQQFAENNTSKHKYLYTRDKLNELISKVKNAIEALKKSDQDRHLLKKYDVIEVSDIEKDAESVESERELNDSGSTSTTIEVVSEEVETPIIRARKHALSGQQIQADVLTKNTKQKLSELAVGDNVIIPIPQYDRAPTDPRNIQGVVVVEVGNFDHCVGTIAGNLSVVLSRNQVESSCVSSLSVTQIPDLQLSLREAVKKNSRTGGQGFLYCKCKGGCNNSKCKCKKTECIV
ncbi:uncharacterized protein [Mytilus edulis]|uniref:uncharacterized protein n=1 Tax=Mytilus edulis TaxID=6550 RepID=UPI0039EEB0C5